MASVFERKFVMPAIGRTLVAGSYVVDAKEDRRLRYPDAIGADMRAGPGVDLVLDLELEFDIGRFAHIDCLSVLEHSRRPWLLAENLERALLPGGTLFVAAPFVWRVHNYPSDYFRFTIHGMMSLFKSIRWEATGYDNGQSVVNKPSSMKLGAIPFLSRCEACLFGVKVQD